VIIMVSADYRQGYADGFEVGYRRAAADTRALMSGEGIPFTVGHGMVLPADGVMAPTATPRKRKANAYAKAYGRAYKSIRRKHTLKSGKLRKGYTHKRIVKLAHAQAKRGRKK